MWAARNGQLEVVVKFAELGIDVAVVGNVSTVIWFYMTSAIINYFRSATREE